MRSHRIRQLVARDVAGDQHVRRSSERTASRHRGRAISLGGLLVAATLLLAGCGATLPSLQPGASLPDLPARPTDKPTEKPPAEKTEKPPAEATAKPTAKPPAEPTEKPQVEPTEKPPAETEKPPAETEKPPAETEKPAAEPTAEATASPISGTNDSSGSTSPGLILLVVVLAVGLAIALYALYRSRNA